MAFKIVFDHESGWPEIIFFFVHLTCTSFIHAHQPLYNTVRNNKAQFNDGSQICIDYTEKCP